MAAGFRRVAFKTLGCKLNQAETEAVATGFKSLGWDVVDFGASADVVVVNSCTVTNAADRKSRSAMNQALRFPSDASDGSGLVVMTGCYADGHREKLEADGRTYVVGNDHKSRIPQLVDAHFRGEILPGHLESERDPFGYPLAERIFRTRAMVKVQDGCDNFCTFCIIPFVRGRGISRPLDETVRALEEAAAAEYREIVLTGVNMSRWESDNRGFADLVEACLNVKGDFRLRLGSVEPDKIDNRLLDLMTHPKMAPHMHLCLQSGSEKILLSMRRQYTAAGFERIACELRRRVPGFNLTTDVIVGFPGESEDDFADTLKLCERLGFGHIHTFPYSRRDGTRADRMDGHISDTDKKVRAESVRKLSGKTKRIYRSSLLGTVQDVLVERVESQSDGNLTARGLIAPYVPVKFSLPGTRTAQSVQNRFFRVRIKAVEPGEDPDLLAIVESN
ncbi:MAG: tRNA (N(6)-L-threonylcarbamoyladenosine(37)-C(2))-methylthiotransferase MtaB [Spirochaetaceae bacterium]|nr:tRNA (N(6)-L-threonylcarbamoyladenosine(37)-C(2))-methylthiotransferase MtaB [Spirochaetaceae bacterium]